MKVYLAAPGQHTWPTIPDDVQDRLLALLTENFSEEKLSISLKRSRKKCANKHPIKQHLAIGLRAVLRCLKQKQCSLVLVCTTLSPLILTKPILLLSQLHSIPAVRLKNLSNILTKIFAIPHCSTMALKISAQENEHLRNLLDNLLQIIHSDDAKTPSTAVNFVPGKIIAPYQNPKRVPAGVTKKKKNKQKK